MAYTARPQGRGIRIDHNGEKIGRWVVGRHLVIYDGPGRETVCRKYGFKQVFRPGTKGRYWQLPESGLKMFAKAIEDITGEKIMFA